MATPPGHPGTIVEGSTIIQCPSCATKFAIERNVLSEMDSPRFHCSRCDHLFSMTEATRAEREVVTAAVQEIAPVVAAAKSFEPTSWKAEEHSAPKSLEIPKPIATPTLVDPPRENAVTVGTASDDAAQISFGFKAPPAGKRQPLSGFPVEEDWFAPEPELGNISDSEFGYDYGSAGKGSYSPEIMRGSETKLGKGNITAGWSAFSVLALPIAVLMLLLGATAIFLRADSETAAHLSARLFPGAPQIAPTGVQIEQSKVKKVTLDSGESVLVLTGRIANRSGENIKDVVIEGLGFDKGGAELVSARWPLGVSLNKARLKSLSPEMIRNMQASANAKRRELNSGEEQEFSFALLPDGSAEKDGLPEVQFFGSRVYSVRQ